MSQDLVIIFLVFLFILMNTLPIYETYKDQYKPLIAIAVFKDIGTGVTGQVLFTETTTNSIKIDIDIKGLTPNTYHGFHVHEAGDLSDGCTSACTHFNPYNKLHGCPGMIERHVGDLGNLQADSSGNAVYSMTDDVITLSGINNIIGRSLIIHADRDDCGQGGDVESTKTGNAGKRIACAVIGYSKLNFK